MPRIVATRSRREIITFDNRGIGESDAPSGPYRLDVLAEDAQGVLDDARVPSACVLSISLALSEPTRVRALVLGCTSHGRKGAAAPSERFLALCQEWASQAHTNESNLVDELMSLMIPRAEAASASGQVLQKKFKASFLATVRCSVGLQGQLAALPAFDVSDQKSQGGPVCVW